VGDDDGRRIPEQYAEELGCFYDAHAGWLFGHAYLRTQRDRELAAARELAADLVQDTFEAAARNWETLRSLAPGQQRTWLRTTLSHKETDHFRRRVLARRKQSELHREYQAAGPDPEQQVLSALRLERIAEIIKSLPPRQQKIALMKWNDDMTEAEIAAELDCAKGTVAAQVHEIRRKLIDGLGSYYPFAGDEGEGEAS
jgi:RNA polymerase sigma-70 factor (ECF subfamily)